MDSKTKKRINKLQALADSTTFEEERETALRLIEALQEGDEELVSELEQELRGWGDAMGDVFKQAFPGINVKINVHGVDEKESIIPEEPLNFPDKERKKLNE